MAIKQQTRVLAEGSLILVTGASGFIGSHVVNEALAAGYRVRGTVRSAEKAEKSKKAFSNANYSTAIVEDFQHEGVFDEAVKGCDAVIHVASDLSYGFDPNVVVKGNVAGVLSILKSAAKSSVKRFVLTSSSAAALFPHPEAEFTASADTWNQLAVDIAWAPPPYTPERIFPVYAASKTEAERAFWKFMDEEKPGFVANAILPNFTLGQVLIPGATGATGNCVPDLFRHGTIPPMPSQYMIDVVDNARLHVVAAALDSSLKNERIFAFNVTFTWTQIIDLLKKLYPNAALAAQAPPDEKRDLSKVPNEVGGELLKTWYGQETGYKPFEQSVRENLAGVV